MSQGQRHVEPGQQVVVVGVDGSRLAQQAVRWAAIEARLRAARLLIRSSNPTAPARSPRPASVLSS